MNYYSTKELADMLGISKQKVYRYIKSNCIIEAHQETVKGNTVKMYDESVLNILKSVFYTDTTITGTVTETPIEVHHDAPDEAVNDIVVIQLKHQIELLEQELKFTKEQYEIQINQLEQSNNDKQEEVLRLIQLLDQEQQLRLADKKLLEVSAEPERQKDKEKTRKWWQFWK